MPRTSLQQVQSLADPLQQYNWDIIIPNMPGTADSRTFTYKAQTSSIPGSLLESVPVALHGVELRFAGRRNFSHSLPVTLLETRDAGTRDMMMNWHELARSWINNSGAYKQQYGVPIQMVLYDDLPQEIKQLTLIGGWPENVDDSSVDNSQSGAVMMSVTFSYDFVVDGLVF